jgi:ribosomal protein S18 acetylase RimI-like enzyme
VSEADAGVVIRAPRLADVPAMARVLVQSWRETYRGLMRDAVLDDPDAVARREHYWTAALTDPQYAENRAAVAERGGDLIGVAMSGPPLETGPWDRQLYVLYVLRQAHGSGAGAELLEAVLGAAESAVLWVADPNPRAQAFYRRQGFEPDGTEATHDGVHEIRMSRAPH